jgi:hypothetical protein
MVGAAPLTELRPIGELVAEWVGGSSETNAAVRDAALGYAARGWPVFPMTETAGKKRPLTEHGLSDATRDPAQIRSWHARWPRMLVAIATGEASGIVVLDVDGPEGFDSLENLAGPAHPRTPTDHTPRGGCHLLFRWPGHFVKTIAGKLGPGLDVRGDGGSCIMSPGPMRFFDPHLGLDTPLAAMPRWMVIPEPEPKPAPKPTRDIRLSRYGEAALDGAVKAIIAAPAGQQHETLNRESFAIGGLVAAGALPAGLALESLGWAARQMPSYDRRRWRIPELDKQVRNSFCDGQLHPRAVPA